MRNVVGVLVAAAVGIHCSGTIDAPDTEGSEPEIAVSAPVPGAPRQAPPEPETTEPEENTRPSLLDLSALVHDGSAPQVTSKVMDGMGTVYATGTFVGSVVIGDTRITSRGDKDVFLLKLGPTGSFKWVRAMGSAALETSPRVTLEDRRVTIVGMTKGEMDCGAGPLPTWDSSTFFLCIFGGDDGSAVSGGVFPTGNL